MKFKLEMKNGDGHTVTVEFSANGLDEFHEYMNDFLRGCGFVVQYDVEGKEDE